MVHEQLSVDLDSCRGRQARLLAEMRTQQLELVIATSHEAVQWLTGAFTGPLFAPAASLSDDGKLTLIMPSRKVNQTVAADEVLAYEEKWHSTLRDQQRRASNEVLISALSNRPQSIQPTRLGGEWSSFGPQLLAAFGEPIDIEPTVFRLRRRKDADELQMMRRANEANRAMYARAREIIQPGINELEVYSELQATAVNELGEALTYFGQDFRCNARGGLPRNREAQAGELYILDLGVGFRGYCSDNARTIAVDRQPTDDQQLAWQRLSEVFPLVESRVRPGVSCRQLFEEVQALLDQHPPWVFNHHLGHGVGLRPHEGPHLNPNWDDTFQVGDFFTVEPGLYHEDLRHGIRLEENYLVTESGVEKLTDYPLGLC